MRHEDITDPFTKAAILVAVTYTDWVVSELLMGRKGPVTIRPQDLDGEILADIAYECERFQKENADDIGADLRMAGSNFWKARNGVDSWEGAWPGATKEKLVEAAKKYGPLTLFFDENGSIQSSCAPIPEIEIDRDLY